MEGLLDKLNLGNIGSMFSGLLNTAQAEPQQTQGLIPASKTKLNPLLTEHFSRLKIEDTAKAKQNLDKFTNYVGMMESDNNLLASNKARVGDGGSSAMGKFQYLTDNSNGQSALQTAINRSKKYVNEPWMADLYVKGNITDLNDDQQTLLFHGDMFEKKGSDALMKRVLQGDPAAMEEAYKTLHHTNPDEATLKRMNKMKKLIYQEATMKCKGKGKKGYGKKGK